MRLTPSSTSWPLVKEKVDDMKRQVAERGNQLDLSRAQFGVVSCVNCACSSWEMKSCVAVPIIMTLNGEVVKDYLGKSDDEFDHVAFVNRYKEEA